MTFYIKTNKNTTLHVRYVPIESYVFISGHSKCFFDENMYCVLLDGYMFYCGQSLGFIDSSLKKFIVGYISESNGEVKLYNHIPREQMATLGSDQDGSGPVT